MNLDVSKACQDTDIPSKIIKENTDIFASSLHSSFNTSVTNSEFPSILKQADITSVFKKGEDILRPVSILPSESTIFERCLFRQINENMDAFLLRHQCGFRKGYSTQRCLLIMLEKWTSAVDIYIKKKKKKNWVLTDLSKVFTCLSHKLLLVKLHAYGFRIPALVLVYSYFKNRKQRTKINFA